MGRQPTPGFLPEQSHGQRSLAGYSPEGRKESEATEVTEHICTRNINSFSYSQSYFISSRGRAPHTWQVY